ncbi:hypothetical protein Tco_0255608 [Tanacetum coccineum]
MHTTMVPTTSKDNEDPSWSTSFKTRRTQKTSSALEVLWKTLFLLYLYMIGTLRIVLTAPPPGCDVAKSSVAARSPRGQYDFVNIVEAGQGLIRSPGHGAWTIARAADRAQDVGYLHDGQTDRRDIRLEIDVVRCQMTAYETMLHEERQAYLSFEDQNMALLARLETLETHMSHMDWQCQSAKDRVVRQMMRTHVLEARAQIDTMEDTSSSC